VTEYSLGYVKRIEADGTATIVAGTGADGWGGDGGPATSAGLYYPTALARDIAGNLYIADQVNQRIRKVDTAGIITTVAGSGATGWGGGGYGGDGGPATSAVLNFPQGVAVDANGIVYLADTGNHRVRKIAGDGTISTYAGTGVAGFSGDGGVATSAKLSSPSGLAVDPSGNLYIADTGNGSIRKVTTGGTISTVAGSGVEGCIGIGGPATSAQIFQTYSVALSATGDMYIVGDSLVMKVGAGGTIDSSAGGGCGFHGYTGDGGPATSALFNYSKAVALDDSGNYYVSDFANNVVRKINTSGIISTYSVAPLNGPFGILAVGR
jgi:hypothetical protein